MKYIILFDGVCNLCNGAVQFIIKKDPTAKFRFASLQSDYGQAVLKQHHLPSTALSTFVLIDQGRVYTQSTAALRVFKILGGLWSLFYLLIVIPRFIRNGIYASISKRRYKLFGIRESCMLPTPELRQRFLD